MAGRCTPVTYEVITPIEFVGLADEDERRQPLDVREEWETAIAAVESSLRIPMNAVAACIAEPASSRPIAVLRHSGRRSAGVAAFLAEAGFATVRNIAGSIDAWAQTVDPNLPR